MKLTKIQLAGNEHRELKADVIYAELQDDNGHTLISATLEYILVAIRERRYNVEGVTVDWKEARGAKCSTVTLNNYTA